jgi:hypothetical protein
VKLACEALLLFCELVAELFLKSFSEDCCIIIECHGHANTLVQDFGCLCFSSFCSSVIQAVAEICCFFFFFCRQKSQPTPDNSFRDCNNQVMQLSTDHRDGVCIAAAATCQFLQVFYLHQPQALKKSRKNDAVAAPATMVCHLLE